jgi:thiol:disulfide interchange protein DsbC
VPTISATQQSSEVASVEMTRLLQFRLGDNNLEISIPVETLVTGLYMTRFGSNYGYLTEDGRYLIAGNMIDLIEGANLTDIARQSSAIDEIDKVSIDDMAVFPAIGEEKAVLTIFTDTSCPYCKKLYGEISHLQKAGISVHYLPYPRGGSKGPGYQTMRQVWCAEDRAKAMSIAKEVDTGSLPSGDCDAARLVDEGYDLGNRVGVTGTPSLFKTNGENIQGYVPYRQLIQRVLEN